MPGTGAALQRTVRRPHERRRCLPPFLVDGLEQHRVCVPAARTRRPEPRTNGGTIHEHQLEDKGKRRGRFPRLLATVVNQGRDDAKTFAGEGCSRAGASAPDELGGDYRSTYTCYLKEHHPTAEIVTSFALVRPLPVWER